MHQDPVPAHPICPLCEQDVLPGDHVVFAHAEIIHLNCHLKREGMADAVASLLRRNPGVEYCYSCLARLLHSKYEPITTAVATLRMTSRYRVMTMGRCSVCSNEWTTVQADPPSVSTGA